MDKDQAKNLLKFKIVIKEVKKSQQRINKEGDDQLSKVKLETFSPDFLQKFKKRVKCRFSSILVKKTAPQQEIAQTKNQRFRRYNIRYQGEWRCPSCGLDYTIKTNLIAHIRNKHKSSARSIICKVEKPRQLKKVLVPVNRFRQPQNQ